MISYIPKKKLREKGDTEGAQLVNKILDQNEPFSVQNWVSEPQSRKMTADEALSLCMEAGLTKHNYEVIRNMAIKCGHDLYPCYFEVKLYTNMKFFGQNVK